MQYLGIDYGNKRVGLAIGDDHTKLSRPIDALLLGSADEFIPKIKNFLSTNQIDHLVLGLPRGLDGQDTRQTQEVMIISDKLKKELLIPVTLQDEAMTSELAKERLSLSKKIVKQGELDSEAASIILQDYLNSL
jgi:putative Holliday junction resolvase